MSKPKKPKLTAPDRFARGIVRDVQKRFETTKLEVLWIDAFQIGDSPYNVHALHQHNNVYWGVREVGPSGDLVGGGWFRFIARPRRVLQEARAAIYKRHQGRGIYPRVLKALRRTFRRPLESDVTLSEKNKRAWGKVAGFDPNDKRFRTNPKSRVASVADINVADQIRYAWLVMEGHLP